VIRNRTAILALLTGLNLLNYIDRAVVAAVLEPMQTELDLSNLEAGLLQSAFLIGYFLTSPLFGARADKGPRKGLIAIGVVIWSLATAATGLSGSVWTLLLARVVVGVGEASYATLAPTIIDDLTPPESKGTALSIFYLAIPVGFALGYVIGGQIGHAYGWRAAFYFTGIPGVALALTCLLIVEPPRKLAEAKERLVDAIRKLASIPLYRRAVFGYISYTAALSAFAYWAPQFLLRRFPDELDLGSANLRFGLITIISGAIGTAIGGRWADVGARKLPKVDATTAYDSLANRIGANHQLRICAVGMIIATPLAVLCFLMPSSTAFFAIALVAEIGLFLSTSPVNAVFLRTVPTELRASAMAASIFAIHLFGDLWSTAALGLLKDLLPLVIAMMALPLTFALSAFQWWPRKREAE
jgi:MFS transporter, Spinster family, sphingosine-1-phosphate transporter